MGQILRVTKAFSVLSDPTGHTYTPGELVDASHPHVKGRETNFETVEAHVSARSGRVEQATAAPGERRTRSRARKAAAKKPAAKKAPVKKAEPVPVKPADVEPPATEADTKPED